MSPTSTLPQTIALLLEDIQSQIAIMRQDPVISTHTIRKRTKFIRALLVLDPDSPEEMKTKLKTISHILSPYRDAQVNLDTYQTIISQTDLMGFPEIEVALNRNPFVLDPFPAKVNVANIKTLTAGLSGQLKASKTNLSTQVIYSRVYQSFNSGKKALQRVRINPESELVHVWRKKTKLLWYQLRFLFGDELDKPDHPLTLSNTLGKLLGEVHDLDVVMSLLALEQKHPFQLLAQKLRQEQLTRSLNIGQSLYSYQKSKFYHLIKQS